MGFVVVYDACVLYPAPVRDLLMEIAISGLVQAKWTERIHQEWMSSLVADRPDIESRIQQTRRLMDVAIPDALVTHYESLIDGITLPDPKGRHVLAAVIACAKRIRACLQNPEISTDKYLAILSSSRLPVKADLLREYKD